MSSTVEFLANTSSELNSNATDLQNSSIISSSKGCLYKGQNMKLWENALVMFNANPGWISFDFLLFGVITTLVALAGLAGNTIFIVVLRKSKRFITAAPYLICLAVCDNIFIALNHFLSNIFFGLKHIIDVLFICGTFYNYYRSYIYPILRATLNSCGLLTAALTVTRFISIKKPLQSKIWLTKKLNWTLAVSLVAVPFALNFVYFIIHEVIDCHEPNGEYIWNIVYKRFRLPSSVQSPLNTSQLVIGIYGAWVTIAVFNVLLMMEVRKANKVRQRMTSETKSRRITVLLLCVTMSFFILVIPSYTSTILTKFKIINYTFSMCDAPTRLVDVRMAYGFRILYTFNSCSNFFWFLMLGPGFRDEVAKVVFFWRKTDVPSTKGVNTPATVSTNPV